MSKSADGSKSATQMRETARQYLSDIRKRRADPNAAKAEVDAKKQGRVTATRSLAGKQRKPASTVTGRAPALRSVKPETTEIQSATESAKRSDAISRLQKISGKPAPAIAQPRRLRRATERTPAENEAVRVNAQLATPKAKKTKSAPGKVQETRTKATEAMTTRKRATTKAPKQGGSRTQSAPKPKRTQKPVDAETKTSRPAQSQEQSATMPKKIKTEPVQPNRDSDYSAWLETRVAARSSARSMRAEQTALRLAERAKATRDRATDAEQRRSERLEMRSQIQTEVSKNRGTRPSRLASVSEARMERRNRAIEAARKAAAAKAAREAAEAERQAREEQAEREAEEARVAEEERQLALAEKRRKAAEKAAATRAAKKLEAQEAERKKAEADAKRKAGRAAKKKAKAEADAKAKAKAEAERLEAEKAAKKAAAAKKRKATLAAKKKAQQELEASAKAKAEATASKKATKAKAKQADAPAEPAHEKPDENSIENIGDAPTKQPAAASSTTAVALDLATLANIGPAMRARLTEIGINTVDDLAATNPQALRDRLGAISVLANVEQWIEDAQKLTSAQQKLAA
ncbi:MAG: hypothetical protein AAF251_08310 [Pseudomonadota bacterium]